MSVRLPYDDVELKVYDPDQTDKDKKVIGTYKNAMDLERKLGIGISSITRAMGDKSRTYSKVLDKKVAIRLVKKV
jgi:hypothetical protein